MSEELRCYNPECNKIILKNKFCNRSCSASYNNKIRPKGKKRNFSKEALVNIIKANNLGKGVLKFPLLQKECKYCTNIFKYHRYEKRTFCSKKCQFDWQRENPILITRPKRSKGEIYFAELCSNEFEIKTNYFAVQKWDCDIFIEKLKIAVFWNGQWHYKQMFKNQVGLKQTQNRDRIKEKLYKQAGIKIYIIKEEGSFNKNFVEEQFEIFKQTMASIPSVS